VGLISTFSEQKHVVERVGPVHEDLFSYMGL
jgi:hypothetical protein